MHAKLDLMVCLNLREDFWVIQILILTFSEQAFGSTGFGKYDFVSKTNIDEDKRRSELKMKENHEILQRIRYLKTLCICRLFCTGFNRTI